MIRPTIPGNPFLLELTSVARNARIFQQDSQLAHPSTPAKRPARPKSARVPAGCLLRLAGLDRFLTPRCKMLSHVEDFSPDGLPGSIRK